MADRWYVAAPFLAIGIAFIAIGVSVNRAFTAIDIAFIVIALVRMSRR